MRTQTISKGTLFSLVVALTVVTTGASVAAAQDTIARFFDIRDLLPAPDDESSVGAISVDAIVDAIRTFVTPPLDDSKGEFVDFSGGRLLVRARPEQCEWIKAFLSRRRTKPELLVQIDCQFLTVSPAALERLGLASGGEALVLASDADRNAFLDRATRDSEVRTVTAPRLLVSDLQRASVHILSETHFVTDWAVYEKVEPDGGPLVVPLVRTLKDGVTLETIAVTLDDHTIGLDFTVESSEIQRPVEVRSTEHGRIALPKVRTMRVASKVVLADGATAVFASGADLAVRPVVVLQVRLIRPGDPLPK